MIVHRFVDRAVRREFSARVKLAAWQRCGGQCEQCTARLFPGKYDYHHVKEDTFGGEPVLENCAVLCVACHAKITGTRARDIAKSNRIRNKYIGGHMNRKQNRRGFRGWRKFDGTAVWNK